MNEESHWDSIAPEYNTEVFDVFKSDKNKRLVHYFNKYANKSHKAIDFGCGTGKAFPFMSPRFKSILALDISKECLITAKQRGYKNIRTEKKDLTKNVRLPISEFIFCCNVAILPEAKQNMLMIRNIYGSLKKGGSAVIVVPSMDSILFYAWRLIDWYQKEKVKPENIPASELNYFNGSKRNLFQGIVMIDKVPTKHYSKSELEVIFNREGFRIKAIEKVEYEWTTEFAKPPAWMKEPYPWDWLVECGKD